MPIYVVPHGLIDHLVGFPFHRGVLACGAPALAAHPGNCAESGSPITLVICPKLTDPENLGAIARIGEVFGIDAILAGPQCPDPFSRRVLRVSMGSILAIPVIVSERLAANWRTISFEHSHGTPRRRTGSVGNAIRSDGSA